MSLPFPHIDPVALSLGPIKIYWYALSYIVGIMGAAEYAKFLQRRYSNGMDVILLDRFAYGVAIFGVILGGRLGHVLFYDPLYYMNHPLEILMTWKGGMSFHGGLAGVLIAAFLFCRKHHKGFFQLMDVAAVTVPFALFLGRVANFINAELYGNPTTAPWGIIFPGGGPLPRHPTQLYEAVAEGVLLLLILSIVWVRADLRHTQGRISGLFLLLYGAGRFLIEFFKDPIAQSSQTVFLLSNGQLLCLPMLLFGIYLVCRKNKKEDSLRT